MDHTAIGRDRAFGVAGDGDRDGIGRHEASVPENGRWVVQNSVGSDSAPLRASWTRAFQRRTSHISTSAGSVPIC
ncbi:hypothetical protein RE0346_17660 [Prescottella equi]|nr:hypothetical protein RE0346_17660 [Prescottella equi]